MPNVNWRMDVSLGNLLSIGTILFGVIVGWANLNSRVEANEARLGETQTVLERLDKEIDSRLDAVEAERVPLAQKLVEMQTDIRYMRQAIEALGAKRTGNP